MPELVFFVFLIRLYHTCPLMSRPKIGPRQAVTEAVPEHDLRTGPAKKLNSSLHLPLLSREQSFVVEGLDTARPDSSTWAHSTALRASSSASGRNDTTSGSWEESTHRLEIHPRKARENQLTFPRRCVIISAVMAGAALIWKVVGLDPPIRLVGGVRKGGAGPTVYFSPISN